MLLQVVGGMTWCIETCNFDVDVDLLFHENLTIGQKMYVPFLFILSYGCLEMYGVELRGISEPALSSHNNQPFV
jgi:hypothetical protein